MNIADALVRDLLTERPRSPEAKTCFACGRPYSRGDGRFCGRKCRRAYDLGFTPGEVVSKPRDGVSLPCRGCGRQFVSNGLRCCSVACERQSHESDANAALMAEVGMDLAAKANARNVAVTSLAGPVWGRSGGWSERTPGSARANARKEHPGLQCQNPRRDSDRGSKPLVQQRF